MSDGSRQGGVARSASENAAPLVKIAIGTPVSGFEFFGTHVRMADDGMTCVVTIPVAVQKTVSGFHPAEEGRSGVGRCEMERGCFDA